MSTSSSTSKVLQFPVPLHTAEDLRGRRLEPERSRWQLAELAGRVTEISAEGAAASLTAAVGLVLDAQRQGEPVAWISREETSFFPPDLAESGVDLDALAVVRVPDAHRAARAADRLMRSGAFGLVILDLGGREVDVPVPLWGRLSGLALKHDTALLCLTEKQNQSASIGSLVSLRAEAMREPLGSGRFRCKIKILKDKRRGPNWSHEEEVHGPAGLR